MMRLAAWYVLYWWERIRKGGTRGQSKSTISSRVCVSLARVGATLGSLIS